RFQRKPTFSLKGRRAARGSVAARTQTDSMPCLLRPRARTSYPSPLEGEGAPKGPMRGVLRLRRAHAVRLTAHAEAFSRRAGAKTAERASWMRFWRTLEVIFPPIRSVT